MPFKNKLTYNKWYNVYSKKPEVILAHKLYHAKSENKLRDKLLFQKRYQTQTKVRLQKQISSKKYYHSIKGKKKHNETVQKQRLQTKLKVYNHYSNFDIKCNCCGEKEILFLSLDHINNDGYKHRKNISNNTLGWIIKNNFPPIFQLLCMNCNHGKMRTKSKICPHQLLLANNFLKCQNTDI